MNTMTLDQAANAAASWWIDQIKSGAWDNGDAKTEAAHAAFASLRPMGASEDDLNRFRQGIADYLTNRITNEKGAVRWEIYSDYGCPVLDTIAATLGVDFESSFHGPQKAGTFISREGDGFAVHVKAGYGASNERLCP